MTVQARDSSAADALRPEVQRIIAAGRSGVVRREGLQRSVWLLGLLSAVLLWSDRKSVV